MNSFHIRIINCFSSIVAPLSNSAAEPKLIEVPETVATFAFPDDATYPITCLLFATSYAIEM